MVQRILLLAVAVALCLPLVRFASDEWGPQPTVDFGGEAWKARAAVVARARVFVRSPPEIRTLDLSRTPHDPAPLDLTAPVDCRYAPKRITGTTAKFDCELPDGAVVKVKYGWSPEKSGEVAATRLLAALGFGADHVAMVPRLRCRGCPPFPYEMMTLAESFYAPWTMDLFGGWTREFTWVSVERKMAARGIEVDPFEGWDWSELPTVDASKGGATRAELDALRLIAIFLSHWDNKATNHRLVCEGDDGTGDDPSAPCEAPLLMLQDVGSTFGPGKVKHQSWADTPIWTDADHCVVSQESMPFGGGHFTPIRISEEGRALLASKLTQLSGEQIRALFVGARFPDPATGDVTGDVTAWVETFRDKVRQIAGRTCRAGPS